MTLELIQLSVGFGLGVVSTLIVVTLFSLYKDVKVLKKKVLENEENHKPELVSELDLEEIFVEEEPILLTELVEEEDFILLTEEDEIKEEVKPKAQRHWGEERILKPPKPPKKPLAPRRWGQVRMMSTVIPDKEVPYEVYRKQVRAVCGGR